MSETKHQWELDEALQVVRDLQPLVRDLDYHIALGGGVINKGYSDKDIDLYVLPVFKGNTHDDIKVMALLSDYFSKKSGYVNVRPLFGSSAGNEDEGEHLYSHQSKFVMADTRRIDVFVGRGNL